MSTKEERENKKIESIKRKLEDHKYEKANVVCDKVIDGFYSNLHPKSIINVLHYFNSYDNINDHHNRALTNSSVSQDDDIYVYCEKNTTNSTEKYNMMLCYNKNLFDDTRPFDE